MLYIKHPYGFFGVIADTEQGKSWWIVGEKKVKGNKFTKQLGCYKDFNDIEELYKYIARSHFLTVDEVKKMARVIDNKEDDLYRIVQQHKETI